MYPFLAPHWGSPCGVSLARRGAPPTPNRFSNPSSAFPGPTHLANSPRCLFRAPDLKKLKGWEVSGLHQGWLSSHRREQHGGKQR